MSRTYDRLIKEWMEVGYSEEILEKVFHGNAETHLAFESTTTRKSK